MNMTADEKHLLQETHDAVIRIESQCPRCRKDIADLEKVVYGNNGDKGLKHRVSSLEWFRAAAMGIIGFLTSLTMAIIGYLVAWFKP